MKIYLTLLMKIAVLIIYKPKSNGSNYRQFVLSTFLD